MKSWILQRISWMDARLASYSACANPVIPSLVISKINYHPQSDEITESSDYEFIEITNAGTQTVNLTGIYMRELGIGYQFPANATLDAGKRLILAGNSAKFSQFYGFSPFGEFSRELSNKSEKIVLADAFGNVIDSVRYSDTIPWPALADGNGYFLQLTNLKSNNALPESWTAATDIMTGAPSVSKENHLVVYPNPARNQITIETENMIIETWSVSNLSGRVFKYSGTETESPFSISIADLSPGIYLLKIKTRDNKVLTHKINKL
jgi:hypothetical protein